MRTIQFMQLPLLVFSLLQATTASRKQGIGQHVLQDDTHGASQIAIAHDQPQPAASSKNDLADLREKYRVPALLAASSFAHHAEDAQPKLHINVTGVRRQGTSIAATTQDQWHLGGLTKAMTATLIALLIKNGHFTYSTPVPTIILKSPHLRPILPFINPAFLRMPLGAFLSHRAGVSVTWASDARLVAHLWSSDAEQKTKEDRLALTKLALSTAPDTNHTGKFLYNDLNYVLAGAIVDGYSPQKTWEEFLREALFEPLDMARCGLGPNPESSFFSVKNPWPHLWGPRHLPFTDGNANPVPVGWVPLRLRDVPPALSSAATVHCPTESYVKFLRLHASRGLLERDLLESRGGNPLEPGPVLPLPPSTVLDLRVDDFAALHTPIYFSPVGGGEGYGSGEGVKQGMYYTPGAWNVPVSAFALGSGEEKEFGGGPVYHDDSRSLSLKSTTYRLSHEGSNTMNDAMAWVDVDTEGGRGSGEFRFAATNIGGMSELLWKVLKGLNGTHGAIE